MRGPFSNASIRDRYGGRRALWAAARANLLYRLGALPVADPVDWPRVDRVVFVCRGNVCRSPFAQWVAHRAGLPAISVGLHTDQGTVVNATAARVALELSIDMTQHRSLSVDAVALDRCDLVLGMEPEHIRDARIAAVADTSQVSLLGLFTPAFKTAYLHDPFGLSDEYFRRCFAFISSAVEAIAETWRRAREPIGGHTPHSRGGRS